MIESVLLLLDVLIVQGELYPEADQGTLNKICPWKQVEGRLKSTTLSKSRAQRLTSELDPGSWLAAGWPDKSHTIGA